MFQNCKIVATGCDPKAYHNAGITRGEMKFPMSPSSIKEFARCPSRWKAGYQMPDSKSKSVGNLFDCFVLTPEQFGNRYAVQPETYVDEKGVLKAWNYNANACKDFREQCRLRGLEVVSRKEVAEASDAKRSEEHTPELQSH